MSCSTRTPLDCVPDIPGGIVPVPGFITLPDPSTFGLNIDMEDLIKGAPGLLTIASSVPKIYDNVFSWSDNIKNAFEHAKIELSKIKAKDVVQKVVEETSKLISQALPLDKLVKEIASAASKVIYESAGGKVGDVLRAVICTHAVIFILLQTARVLKTYPATAALGAYIDQREVHTGAAIASCASVYGVEAARVKI